MIEQRNDYQPTDVSAPGETLRELLEERGISQADLAIRMGRPVKTINEIVNGKAGITTETALGLELVVGVPAGFWLSREAQYREHLARVELEAQLANGRDWASRFPLKAMEQLQWIPKSADWRHRVRALLEFFGVASAEQWQTVFDNYSVAFRRSPKFPSNVYALTAWLRAGVRMAQARPAAEFNREVFLAALADARTLTRTSPAVFTTQLPEAMARAGVIVAFVPELPGSRASGATRWISTTKALIQLSLRYKTDDHLWFTFFHEAAHVLLHSKKTIFIELNGYNDSDEEEANIWASNFLIPPQEYYALCTWPTYTRTAISTFATQTGVAPGIVVGRLQHDGRLPHSHLNDLKQRFEWAVAEAGD